MRYCCLTLDLEADHGLKEQRHFYALEKAGQLQLFLKDFNIPITIFVVGALLEKELGLCDFRELNVEFGLHSYYHQTNIGISQEEELYKAVETYYNYFKKMPRGYRSPYGRINKKQLDLLEKYGFMYDSSLIPRPLYHNNIFAGKYRENQCFFYSGRLIEVPISVVPKLKIPMSISMFQFLGFNFFKKSFEKFGLPPIVVIYFHLHDIFKTSAVDHLPFYWRLFYSKKQKMPEPINTLEKMIHFLIGKGFEFIKLSELCQKFAKKELVFD